MSAFKLSSKTHFILGNLMVAVVFMNENMPIISCLACLIVAWILHIHFCETINNGRQASSEKSNSDFSSLPFLCSVFMAPVTGILLQQFVSSALLLRLCIIYDLDSKMLVNCSTRNNGMWQQWIPHSWPKYLCLWFTSHFRARLLHCSSCYWEWILTKEENLGNYKNTEWVYATVFCLWISGRRVYSFPSFPLPRTLYISLF